MYLIYFVQQNVVQLQVNKPILETSYFVILNWNIFWLCLQKSWLWLLGPKSRLAHRKICRWYFLLVYDEKTSVLWRQHNSKFFVRLFFINMKCMITFFFDINWLEHHNNTIFFFIIWLFMGISQPICKIRRLLVVQVKSFIIENIIKPNKYSSPITLIGWILCKYLKYLQQMLKCYNVSSI